MERAIQTINQFNLSKEQIDNFASQIINDLYNNGGDVLHTAICLSAMEGIIKAVRSGVKDLVREEAEKHGENNFDYKGASFTKVNRASYDYSACDAWAEADKRKKEIEKVMKSITNPVADADTGEMIYPAQKKVTESVSIKIK